ncbi:MAG: hypothetical protein CMP34_03330 [Rickettsiales bacterium]|nr:hypothetical protein [Rickettsiales bacterium]|tara:strand:+ start:558 stop:1478 length:921 start_codon:yes stop_codon:yes gene_type:complete
MVKNNSYIINILVFSIITIISLFFAKNSYSDELNNNDPWENVNRKIFDFNNTLDDNVFIPIAKAWRKVPDIPREPIANAASMAKTPVSLGNAILQLNKKSVGDIIARFIINITFGLGGLFDVASTEEFGGIKEVEEDFGQTLATWGVPDGPYVMLPIFGPSSVRDGIGMGVDAITNPLSFAYRMNGIGLEGRLSGPVVRGVDKRETYLDYVEEMKSSSLDFYATMRSLYRQKRKKDISGEFENEKVSLDLLPVDVYDDSELIEEVEKIVSTSMDNKTIVSSPSSYKGSLPSSNYPDYNEFPVSYTN